MRKSQSTPDLEDVELLRGKSPAYIAGWNRAKTTKIATKVTPMHPLQWSFSSLKTFEQCPKKYYHLKVAKDVKDTGSEASIYGNLAHKAAEDYVAKGTPLPKEFEFMGKPLDALKNLPGEKHCELRLGVTAGYQPTEFFGEDVWLRTIADLLIVDGEQGYLVDYKTGKSAKYADTTQLDIMAAAAFTHFPQLKTLKSALLFLVSGDFIRKVHTRDMLMSYYAAFEPPLERLQAAMDNGVWNPVSGPLCRKYCPVVECPHNGRR